MTLLPLRDGNRAIGMSLAFHFTQSGSSDAQGAACTLGSSVPIAGSS